MSRFLKLHMWIELKDFDHLRIGEDRDSDEDRLGVAHEFTKCYGAVMQQDRNNKKLKYSCRIKSHKIWPATLCKTQMPWSNKSDLIIAMSGILVVL